VRFVSVHETNDPVLWWRGAMPYTARSLRNAVDYQRDWLHEVPNEIWEMVYADKSEAR
jgi:hypothetical protein